MKKQSPKLPVINKTNNTIVGNNGNLMIHGKLIIIIYHQFMVM